MSTTPMTQTPPLVRTRVGMLPEPLAAVLQSKRLILGKYRLERLLGRGGMSVVFAAEHTMLRKRVAIKFLSLDQCESGAAVARFLHEGRSAARIRSEHVARVIDVDTIPGGLPCMVLEYLEGHDLAYTLQQRGALPMDLAVDYVMQALEAIAEAHTLNIVHRDLKPSNLFVVRRADGGKDIKVIDFGISKSIGGDSDQTAFTKRHSILGSPEYMSPEQALGEIDIDTRTDLWSMGVVLYELLCGSCPFQGADYMEILNKVTRDDAPSISEACPHVPPPLARIIGRCLERDRDKRFQTASELARALLPFGSERARFSYDSILGVCHRSQTDRGTGGSTLTTVGSVPNEEGARKDWKSVATDELALAVDGFASGGKWVNATGSDVSDDAPTARVTNRPEVAIARKNIAPGKYFTRREARPAQPNPSASAGEPSEDHGRRPLISVVRGTLPSIHDDMGPTSTQRGWIHRSDVPRKHRRSSPADLKRRANVVLWATCVIAVITTIALLADRGRAAEPTSSGRAPASVVAVVHRSEPAAVRSGMPVARTESVLANVRPVPLIESGAHRLDVESAELAPTNQP